MTTEALLDAYTGTGVLVIFEPSEVAPYAGVESDWCIEDRVLLSLANAGVLVPINVKADGVWLCKLTTGELSDLEQQALLQSDDHFWINVKGRQIVFGGLEALPNRNTPPDRFVDEFGDWVSLDPGRYRATVCRLVGHHSKEVEQEMNQSNQDIPSYVVMLHRLLDAEEPPHLETVPNFSPYQGT